VIALRFTLVLALFALAACGTSLPTASAQPPIFDVDSATAGCADESVGVDLAMAHALARPGYLDCITVTVLAYPDGTIWLCEAVRDPAAAVCDGNRMQARGLDLNRVTAGWHVGAQGRWSDPVQLLGRVRFQ
jgi:hypothetical protein